MGAGAFVARGEGGVIRDLSLTLRALFARKDVPGELSRVDISFDHPNESFAPSRSTLNLFLYDIREDLELRRSDPTLVRRDDDNALLQPPPLRVVCAYVLTAWPVGGEEPALQEHRLLGQALALLRRFPVLPPELLQGELAQQDLPLTVAQAPSGDDRSEFWTAVGNRLRPSITLRVTVALPIAEPAPLTAPLVKVHELRVGERSAPLATTLKKAAESSLPPARRGNATAKRSGRTSSG